MTSSSMRAGQLRNFSGGVVRSRTSPSFFLDCGHSRKNKTPGRVARTQSSEGIRVCAHDRFDEAAPDRRIRGQGCVCVSQNVSAPVRGSPLHTLGIPSPISPHSPWSPLRYKGGPPPPFLAVVVSRYPAKLEPGWTPASPRPAPMPRSTCAAPRAATLRSTAVRTATPSLEGPVARVLASSCARGARSASCAAKSAGSATGRSISISAAPRVRCVVSLWRACCCCPATKPEAWSAQARRTWTGRFETAQRTARATGWWRSATFASAK